LPDQSTLFFCWVHIVHSYLYVEGAGTGQHDVQRQQQEPEQEQNTAPLETGTVQMKRSTDISSYVDNGFPEPESPGAASLPVPEPNPEPVV
jgi:serine/threonine protein kinase HipA of HipAB toxin-antitoxin module